MKTTATVQWTAGTWVNGIPYTTLDLKDLIQEMADRPGRASGNAMMALIRGKGDYRDRLAVKIF